MYLFDTDTLSNIGEIYYGATRSDREEQILKTTRGTWTVFCQLTNYLVSSSCPFASFAAKKIHPLENLKVTGKCYIINSGKKDETSKIHSNKFIAFAVR